MGMLWGCFSESEKTAVWVSRVDGSVQCDADAAKAQERARAVLVEQGVNVLEERSGSHPDHPFQAQMCGQPTGRVFYFKVPEESVHNAIAVGFVRESSPPNVEGELGE